jgi:hypothetical protein
LQSTSFEAKIKDKIAEALTGKNVTILAYGQTGSGKTFTMNHGGGIIQSAIAQLLESRNSSIAASYFQVLKRS